LSYWDETAGHPLRGPLLKVGRAKDHFAQLRDQVDAFLARPRWDWSMETEEYDDGTREYRVSASVDDLPPIELGLIAGDVVQNVRAALDQLIWGYSAKEMRNLRTAFPIYLTVEEYEEKAWPRISGMSERVQSLVASWQPYPTRRRRYATSARTTPATFEH
jgi:hypothetical protein